MKILTHNYRVVIFEDGRLCFRREGWIAKRTPPLVQLLVAVQFAAIIYFIVH